MAEEIVYIDTAQGLKLMPNAKLYVKLLNKFKVDFQLKLNELCNALEKGNKEEIQVLAHTIKGTSANLALIELSKQSLELENQIKSGAIKPESSDIMKKCFDETLSAIDAVVKQYG
jgi:HPt (histidine-containing phosphotransfer) domain-containing protein